MSTNISSPDSRDSGTNPSLLGEDRPRRPGRRDVELNWISSHIQELSAYKGEWVVIEGECLVAHDPDHEVALDRAKAAGISVTFSFFIPEHDINFPSVW